MTSRQKPTDMGMNRTGIDASPADSKRMMEGAADAADAIVDASALEQARNEYAASAPPVGSMPPPGTLKGAASTAMQALKGNRANVLLDKLGERLAFERSGVRLYEALKVKVKESSGPPPTVVEVEEIRDEELSHFALVAESLRQLGGDPTTMTPCADVTAVASQGILKVVTDPKTTLAQSLDAILSAELTDTAGWDMLVTLASSYGLKDMAATFAEAHVRESAHVARVKSWLQERIMQDAGTA